MRVMMMVQEACRLDHNEEDQATCPGFSSDTRLKISESTSIFEAVRTETECGNRVITAFPARVAAELLGQSLDMNWACRQLRGDFYGGEYSPEMEMPAGFCTTDRSYSGGREPTFYLDPRADSSPRNNPAFLEAEPVEIPHPLQEGDLVHFEITEDSEFSDDFYWRDACGAKEDHDIQEVKAHVRKKFGVWRVLKANPGGKPTIGPVYEPTGSKGPHPFRVYPTFLRLVGANPADGSE